MAEITEPTRFDGFSATSEVSNWVSSFCTYDLGATWSTVNEAKTCTLEARNFHGRAVIWVAVQHVPLGLVGNMETTGNFVSCSNGCEEIGIP